MSFHIIPLLCILNALCTSATMSIDAYGAVKSEFTDDAAATNSDALLQAMKSAGNGDIYDRTVLIPARSTYFIDAVYFNNIHNAILQIEGTLIVNTDMAAWYETESAFYFVFCNNIKITGRGIIDGKGWPWWDYVMKTGRDIRPLALIDFRLSYNIIIEGISLINSPQYYIYLYDLKDVIVRRITILTNPTSTNGAIAFPLNTEGISVLAQNVTMHDLDITNYDDAIAIKPCRSLFKLCKCSSDIYITNVESSHSMGISIGSVQPSSYYNCIRNVVFNKINLRRAFKGIFIKTFPGTSGYGEISNIVYSNIYMKNTIWWPIYIGPQQQTDPADLETVLPCDMYPLDEYCYTQPRVTISNILLKNVIAESSLTYYNSPGVIRCHPDNPCKNITFDNVQIYQKSKTDITSYTAIEDMVLKVFVSEHTTMDYFWRYIIENVQGTGTCNSPEFQQTFPLPHEKIITYNPYRNNTTTTTTTTQSTSSMLRFTSNTNDNSTSKLDSNSTSPNTNQPIYTNTTNNNSSDNNSNDGSNNNNNNNTGGNTNNNDNEYIGITTTTCAYNPNIRDVSFIGVMTVFAIITSSVLGVVSGLIIMTWMGTWIWKTFVSPRPNESLAELEIASHHSESGQNMLTDVYFNSDSR